MFKKLLTIIFLLVSMVSFGKNQKVTIVLDWVPNTNHTGLYVAKNLGFFKEQGLDVTIVQPGKSSSEQIVASGRADFGIGGQSSINMARIKGIPLVSIAALIQHNTSGFTALKGKNISRPKDFEGKNYGGWGSPIETAILKTIMSADGGDPSKVNILTTGSADFFKASETNVDFAWVFEGWTNIEARLKGLDFNYIPLKKYSKALDYYTPLIMTSEKNISKNHELVVKFMNAVKKGYNYSIKNPKLAANILIKEVPELNPQLVMESQEFLSKNYQAEAPYWGMQKQEVWDRYQDWLFENKLIDKKLDLSKAFDNSFVAE